MSRVRPPGGGPVPPRVLRALVSGRSPGAEALLPLRRLLGQGEVTLHRSGREAMRVALTRAAARTGRHEVVIPAYTCFSVPAAAVAAGLRIRLADVDDRGRLDPASIPPGALERASAVVACNLFGVPEPLGPIRARAEPAGALVIDDAAQALGGASAEGPCGGRGAPAVLSFGRGKPLSALGGGALLWPAAGPDGVAARESTPGGQAAVPALGAGGRAAALLRALAWNVARRPAVFGGLRRIPQLHIGETRFDPAFPRGPIAPPSLAILLAVLPGLEELCAATARRVRALAERIPGGTGFEPLVAGEEEQGGYPRLVLRAPDAATRDRALRALADLGATGLYPTALDRIEALGPYLVPGPAPRGAAELAARVLTLPAPEDDRELDEATGRLAAVLPRLG